MRKANYVNGQKPNDAALTRPKPSVEALDERHHILGRAPCPYCRPITPKVKNTWATDTHLPFWVSDREVCG